MHRLSPQEVLRTGQVLSARSLMRMLARYGFDYKRTTGSHILCTHRVFSDEIVGLVQGTNDLIYQMKAAEACLRVSARALAQVVADIIPSKSDIILPPHMTHFRRGEETLVRHNDFPELGFIYQGPDHLEQDVEELDALAKEYGELLDLMPGRFEFKTSRDVDGNLYVSHPIYPLEDVIPRYGVESHVQYPYSSLHYLADSAYALDPFLEIDTLKKKNRSLHLHAYSDKKIGDNLYEIKLLPTSTQRRFAGTQPVKVIATEGGRTNVEGIVTYIGDMIEYHLWREQIWKNIGCILTTDDEGVTHLRHPFLKVRLDYTSPEKEGIKWQGIIQELMGKKPSIEELDAHIDGIFNLIKTSNAANSLHDSLLAQLGDENQRHEADFAKLAARLSAHGFYREDQAGQHRHKVRFTRPKEKQLDIETIPGNIMHGGRGFLRHGAMILAMENFLLDLEQPKPVTRKSGLSFVQNMAVGSIDFKFGAQPEIPAHLKSKIGKLKL